MAVKPDLADKFGLEWLGPSSGGTSAASEGPRLPDIIIPGRVAHDAAHVIVGKQILGVLKNAPDKSESVYNLVDRLQLDIQTILSAVDYLESTAFITVTRDSYGNHELKLTEAGEAWIS